MKLTFSSFLLVLFLATTWNASASTTWYVNGVTGNDGNDCLSPTTACKTIGHAISLASSGDSIMVAAATYTELLTISISLKLIGSGAATTIIDGQGGGTVVTIPNTASHVSLSMVTIRDGYAVIGGGILNYGTLTIKNSTIRGNRVACSGKFCSATGGGIFNQSGANLTISNSNISGNQAACYGYGEPCYNSGSGISNDGTLMLNDSTFSGNAGSSVMFNTATTTINSSTFSGVIGGITAVVNNVNSTMIINNSTLSANEVVDGEIFNEGAITISNSTLTGVGGIGDNGVFNYEGSVTLQNTILAYYWQDCLGTVTSNGYNLSSDGTCNFSGPGDLNNTDPMLGTLGNYGGPTQTIPLLSSSPAIDAGNPSGCTDGNGHLLTTDQRGRLRPDKEDTGGCDMGAYERQSD